ncbi:MAG: glycosyltransferase family 9 protein [Candidatus Omnitrophota bacterium]
MKKILIVNPFGIGDALFSMTVARQIKKALPAVSIGFVCNERTCELAAMNADIDRHYVFNRERLRFLGRQRFLGWVGELGRLAGSVKKERYDTMLDFSLGREFSIAAMFLGIERRIGLDYRGRGIALTIKQKIEGYESVSAVTTQMRLLNMLGIDYREGESLLPLSIPAVEQEAGLQILGRSDDGFVTIAPGGGKSWGPNAFFKLWPADYFAQVINRLQSESSGVMPILVGDASERDLLSEVARKLRRPPVIACGLPIAQLAAILKVSRLLLCNDGGPMHLANALGVPTLSLFGPVDEKVYGPYGTLTPHGVLTQKVGCRPCYRRFRFPPCRFEKRCLTELLPERVWTELKKLLNL